MKVQELICGKEERRDDVRAASAFGLDYVEVVDAAQTTLRVFFLGKAPTEFGRNNVTISGGRRIRDVQITSVRVVRQPDSTLDDYFEARVNKAGDFSDYTIRAVNAASGEAVGEPMDGFDPRYSSVCFSFKAGCPTDLDCKAACGCPPPVRTEPDIDYLAKDYESFRQLMLDRLALTVPAWSETHPPDLGITLVELLAYTGDYLSYFQDAVATEAYLGTARQRISVRRHARLVDYMMHEGCNARAWLTFDTQTDQVFDPSQIYFITAYPAAPQKPVLTPKDLVGVPPTSYEVFEPLLWGGESQVEIFAAHSRISFYTWGDCHCCLPKGSTQATLTDSWDTETGNGGTETGGAPATSENTPGGKQRATDGALRVLRNLKPGDILIFEEVIGPKTGNASDADPTHRQAVCLTSVTPCIDPLYGGPQGTPVVEIEWAAEDALTFPLCVSAQQPFPACGCMEDVSVARGNVILIDNGSGTTEVIGTVPTDTTSPQCARCCEPSGITISSGLFRPVLTGAPVTCSEPLPPPCSAAALIEQDSRQAIPVITLSSIPPAPACADAAQDPPQPCVLVPLFTFDDLVSLESLAERLKGAQDAGSESLRAQLSTATEQALTTWDGKAPAPEALIAGLSVDLEALLLSWTPQQDLLESGPDDYEFVAEVDNAGLAHLRFGDGACGYLPDAGTLFRASYRTGNGTAGNVGAEMITYLVLQQDAVSGLNVQVRNPLAATGGVDPESMDDAKLLAPYAFRGQLERAITADDYSVIAGDNQRRLETRWELEAADASICEAPFTPLQRASGAMRWTGSWYTALVAVDPIGTETADAELIDEMTSYLEPFRRVGQDLLVSPAVYVPLQLAVTVCVLPTFLQGHVEAAVANALSNRVLPDGTLGFFHPDNLTFGGAVYVSAVLATVQVVTGVQNVIVTVLERYDVSEPSAGAGIPGGQLPPDGSLSLGPFEIAQLDNDPNFPENGVLILDVRGGR